MHGYQHVCMYVCMCLYRLSSMCVFLCDKTVCLCVCLFMDIKWSYMDSHDGFAEVCMYVCMCMCVCVCVWILAGAILTDVNGLLRYVCLCVCMYIYTYA